MRLGKLLRGQASRLLAGKTRNQDCFKWQIHALSQRRCRDDDPHDSAFYKFHKDARQPSGHSTVMKDDAKPQESPLT